jgi:hypothetical protein
VGLGKPSRIIVSDKMETLYIPSQPCILIKDEAQRRESNDVRQE